MSDTPKSIGSLGLSELEVVYAISKIVVNAVEIDPTLDHITQIARSEFIFDTSVIYLVGDGVELEPRFARAVGRGRYAEENLPWGEFAAQKAIDSGENYVHEILPLDEHDRIEHQLYLAIPVFAGVEAKGAVVYIRFGGPAFEKDHILLAEYIATHIGELFSRRNMVERIADLEAERRLVRLQEDFMANVSHELNTPLGFIKGYTTTLLRQDAEWDKETLHEFLEIIDAESDRLAELIENLLDSSRLQSGAMRMSMTSITLNTLVKNALNRLQSHYHNLVIEPHFLDEDVGLVADSKRLTQVLDNLISNAAKYAPKSTLEIFLSTENQHAIIVLADNGPGIPSEDIEYIFNRFYRVVKRSAGVRGTGLGLFICDQIIQAHKGTINVESEVNKGTRFIISLPLTPVEKSEDIDG